MHLMVPASNARSLWLLFNYISRCRTGTSTTTFHMSIINHIFQKIKSKFYLPTSPPKNQEGIRGLCAILTATFGRIVFVVCQLIQIEIVALERQTAIHAVCKMLNAVDSIKECLCLFLVVALAIFQTILALFLVVNIGFTLCFRPPNL